MGKAKREREGGIVRFDEALGFSRVCDFNRNDEGANARATMTEAVGRSWNRGDRVNVCMSPGKLVPGAPGSLLLNSRGYFVRVKCVTAHAQSIKSRGKLRMRRQLKGA